MVALQHAGPGAVAADRKRRPRIERLYAVRAVALHAAPGRVERDGLHIVRQYREVALVFASADDEVSVPAVLPVPFAVRLAVLPHELRRVDVLLPARLPGFAFVLHRENVPACGKAVEVHEIAVFARVRRLHAPAAGADVETLDAHPLLRDRDVGDRSRGDGRRMAAGLQVEARFDASLRSRYMPGDARGAPFEMRLHGEAREPRLHRLDAEHLLRQPLEDARAPRVREARVPALRERKRAELPEDFVPVRAVDLEEACRPVFHLPAPEVVDRGEGVVVVSGLGHRLQDHVLVERGIREPPEPVGEIAVVEL